MRHLFKGLAIHENGLNIYGRNHDILLAVHPNDASTGQAELAYLRFHLHEASGRRHPYVDCVPSFRIML